MFRVSVPASSAQKHLCSMLPCTETFCVCEHHAMQISSVCKQVHNCYCSPKLQCMQIWQARLQATLQILCSLPVSVIPHVSQTCAKCRVSGSTSAKVSCSDRSKRATCRMHSDNCAMSCFGNAHLPICQQCIPGRKNQWPPAV